MSVEKTFASYSLGATLYMPVTHPTAASIIRGERVAPAPSIVLCLEDALAERDVPRGLHALATALARARTPLHDAQIFVRPRNINMLHTLLTLPNAHHAIGFVLPKVTIANLPAWLQPLKLTEHRIMPIIETPEFLQVTNLEQLRDALIAFGTHRITAVRAGGNDILKSMALRRERNITAYDTPLHAFLTNIITTFTPAGIPAAAPVFDVIDDLITLAKETKRDVSMGFVSKTAIHPTQVPVIQQAFRVTDDDLNLATSVIQAEAAVARSNGHLIEPATHVPWAYRTLARAYHHTRHARWTHPLDHVTHEMKHNET